ncbi:MAG: S8 family serine peptidase [Planctomycetia bacterium]|nr:S8 family serine peptidase [Planctomycetia bacterium]
MEESSGSNPTASSQGHGTNTTGCVYQVAPGSSLIGIKNTNLSTVSVPYAINYAVKNEATIISNSYGMTKGFASLYSAVGSYKSDIQPVYGFSPQGAEAINVSAAFQKANQSGAVILYAAGNNRIYNGVTIDGNLYLNSQDANKLAYQASPQTITVAAMNTNSTENAWFSNYGACIFVTAPGQSIQTSNYIYLGENTGAEGTATVSGTSFSCPFTAGCIALATQASEQAGAPMSSRLAKHLLVATSQKVDIVGNTGWEGMDARKTWVTNSAGNMFSHTYGFGMVDAEALVKMASEGYAVTEQSFLSIYHTDGSDKLSYSTQAEEVYFSGLKFESSTSETTITATEPFQETSLSTMDTGSLSINNATTMPGGSQLAVSAAGDAMVVVNEKDTKAGSGMWVQSFEYEINETDFDDVNFQALEEVALTLAIHGTLGAMEIIVTHTVDVDGTDYSTSSIFAFAQETNGTVPDSDGTTWLEETLDGIIWTFSSNAFWGEDVAGTWQIDIYDMYNTASDLDYQSLIMTYTMGEMYALETPPTPSSDVPEPATWILLIGFCGWLLVQTRFRRKVNSPL